MPIREHPVPGSLLLCNFDPTFKEPEMVKRRPVIVLSPKIASRPGLCTIVALSTSAPDPVKPYNCRIRIAPTLPKPFDSEEMWLKGDMIYAVGFHRLDLFRTGRSENGKRTYYYNTLSNDTMKQVRACVLHGLGLTFLTQHLT